MDSKNSNTLLLSKKRYSKQDKINNYRKKYSNIRHQYYAMCDKYSSYNKLMLTFTIPSKINNAIIQGKYSKTAYLVELRTYISKQFNNASSEIKYFSNIEMGTKRNNPHLHMQIWTKPIDKYYDCDMLPTPMSETSNTNNLIKTSPPLQSQCLKQIDEKKQLKTAKNSNVGHTSNLDEIYSIYQKTINKFSLNNSRCKMTLPEYENKNYDYVIKDYRKDISDVELWANENAKKGIRKHLGKQVRFYNMSSDKYSQKIYKMMYRVYGKARNMVNEFLGKVVGLFFSLNASDLGKLRELNSEIVDILEQVVNEFFNLGYDLKNTINQVKKLILYWIYGFI